MNKVNYKQSSQMAIEKVNSITSSVLTVARLLKLDTDKLAAALIDDEAHGEYLKKLTVSMINALPEKLRKEAEEAEE